MNTVLTLEASTSAAKAAIYNESGEILAIREESWPWTGVDYQDAQQMVEVLLRCGHEVSQGFDVAAIGLSGIMPSCLLCGRDMQPLSPIWTWANTASQETVNRYKQDSALISRLYQKTGCPAHTQYPLWQLIHRRKTGDTALAQAELITTQLGYIFYCLTGEIYSSRSTESSSGMLNLQRLDWDAEALELAGITREMLSPLAEIDDHMPLSAQSAAALGVKSGIPVCVSAPDGALNQIGSGALNPGCMTFSLGTSGALRIASPQPITKGERNTWCYYIRDVYMPGASTSGAGSCIAWFRRLSGNPDFTTLEQKATEAGNTDIPIYLPFNFGERAPGFNAARPGSFQNLRGNHELGHVYRSILEGIIFNMYHCYELLSAKTGLATEIRLSGGVVHSPLWMQIAAEMFNAPMLLHEGEHASLHGAAAVALKAIGALPSLPDFQPKIIGSIQPDGQLRKSLLARYNEYIHYYNVTFD